jgi:hypothetical protein
MLCDGFQAMGKVELARAMITGILSCKDGEFLNPGKEALAADGVKIGSHALLNRFQVEGIIRLVGSSIGGNLDCSDARFIGCRYNGLLARGMTVTGLLDWRRVTKNSTTLLDLSLARVGQLADHAPSWPEQGNLRLDGFVYATITDDGPTGWKVRRDWLDRQPHASAPGRTSIWPHQSFSPQPYQQLAKVLRESGHEAAAKRILIAKEKARRKHGELGWWGWGGSMLLGATIGHGYRSWQALLWIVFWVVLGGIFFGAGYQKEIVIPAKAEAYKPDKKTRQEQETAFYPDFNPWLYSLDTLVPIINFGQKDYWGLQVACNRSGLIRGGGIRFCVLGILDKPAIRVLYLYRWLHIFVGWVLITLAVTGFTGLVRKE